MGEVVTRIRENLDFYKKKVYESTGDPLVPKKLPVNAYISPILMGNGMKAHVLALIEEVQGMLTLYEQGKQDASPTSAIMLKYGMVLGHVHSLGLRSDYELKEDGVHGALHWKPKIG